jgi:hypothetical protein
MLDSQKNLMSGIPIGYRPTSHEEIMGNLEQPWLVKSSIEFIYNLIDKNFVCFEYGSGSSTFWFSKFTKKVFSVESDSAWHQQMISTIQKNKIDNIDLQLIKCEMHHLDAEVDTENSANHKDYADSINRKNIDNFDLIMIDGVARSLCIENSISMLKLGGILIIDNAERPAYKNAISIIPTTWEKHEFLCKVDTTLVYIKKNI